MKSWPWALLTFGTLVIASSPLYPNKIAGIFGGLGIVLLAIITMLIKRYLDKHRV